MKNVMDPDPAGQKSTDPTGSESSTLGKTIRNVLQERTN